jgi:hypothetical protein
MRSALAGVKSTHFAYVEVHDVVHVAGDLGEKREGAPAGPAARHEDGPHGQRQEDGLPRGGDFLRTHQPVVPVRDGTTANPPLCSSC